MIRQFKLAIIDDVQYEPLNASNMWMKNHHIDRTVEVNTKQGHFAGVPVYIFEISYPKFEIMALKETIDPMDDGQIIGFVRIEVENAIRKQRDFEIQLSDLYRRLALHRIQSDYHGKADSSGDR